MRDRIRVGDQDGGKRLLKSLKLRDQSEAAVPRHRLAVLSHRKILFIPVSIEAAIVVGAGAGGAGLPGGNRP